MLKYTASKLVLRDMKVAKTGRWWDKEFYKSYEILKRFNLPQDYTLSVVLRTAYPIVEFYSEKELKHIPVNGYLFPVDMFDKENYGN